MSHTSLCTVERKEGKAVTETLQEYHNSWLSLPLFWKYLTDKTGVDSPLTVSLYREQDDFTPFWNLVWDISLTYAERWVLLLTFDYAVIKPDNLPAAADNMDYLHLTLTEALPDCNPSHFHAMANDLRREHRKGTGKDIGVNWSSVTDVWYQWDGDPEPWSVTELLEKGKWDDE